MVTTADPQKVFQYYLDNHFKIPPVIRDDLIYCQRALKSHIKLHQMVSNVFREQLYLDPRQKQRILSELETEIYEINAEQQFLMVRLRRIIEEFYRNIKKKNVAIDENATNMAVSKEIVPMITDTLYVIKPATVVSRLSEDMLMHKYFQVETDSKVVYEILDSDDDDASDVVPSVVLIDDDTTQPPQLRRPPPPQQQQRQQKQQQQQQQQRKSALSSSNGQLSLLKPISQRLAANSTDLENNQSVELPVSKNVKLSRLNLRQALKKARTETIAAKAAAKDRNGGAVSPKPNAHVATKSANTAGAQHSGGPFRSANANAQHTEELRKKGEVKARTTRSSAGAAVPSSSSSSSRDATPVVGQSKGAAADMNSSSEDSNPDREFAQPSRSSSPFDSRTLPEHFTQEQFLQFFTLYTPAMHTQMQQRRSKRKRRTVHNNERADFHYGRIEYGSYPPPEKKRKEFLLSPQVKRGLQSKRAAPTKRNGSTSPDEKRGCNECFKSGGSVDLCDECKGYFHQTCHREEDDVRSATAKKMSPTSTKDKFCPACKRADQKLQTEAEAERNRALQSSARHLEMQLAEEKDRTSSLRKESKEYKIQMQNLFNIVNTMKHDENEP